MNTPRSRAVARVSRLFAERGLSDSALWDALVDAYELEEMIRELLPRAVAAQGSVT